LETQLTEQLTDETDIIEFVLVECSTFSYYTYDSYHYDYEGEREVAVKAILSDDREKYVHKMNRQDYTKFSQRLDMLNNRLSKKNKRADRKFYKTLMIVGKQELVTVLSDIDDLMKKTEKEEETKKLKAEIAKKKREKTKKDKEVQNAKAVLKKHGYME
jgi:hypothetical protein